ncbi:hypothetical protein BJX63DRAFT_376762 [Aspergillus granulosus]|uniref:Uncharacterized protein n=1 Tax=Aspergillus granulosus TaxID=176169 RepID=A0ABR4I6C8_9EURO
MQLSSPFAPQMSLIMVFFFFLCASPAPDCQHYISTWFLYDTIPQGVNPPTSLKIKTEIEGRIDRGREIMAVDSLAPADTFPVKDSIKRPRLILSLRRTESGS